MRHFLILSLVLTVTACGARSKAAETAFIDCEEAAIKAKVPQLLPTVQSILTSGVSDWRAQLDALAKYAGEDALACTVSAAAVLFSTHKVGGPIGAAGDPAKNTTGLVNARAAVSEHAWKLKDVR